MTEAESWAMPALPITITGVPAIAERLRITRQALRLKQAALCRQTGIAPNTYNQWEQERGRPDLDGARGRIIPPKPPPLSPRRNLLVRASSRPAFPPQVVIPYPPPGCVAPRKESAHRQKIHAA